jgi:hypothetical protein
MTKEKLEQLLDLIDDLVRDDETSTWLEKKEAVLACVDERTRVSLEEFTSWFEE